MKLIIHKATRQEPWNSMEIEDGGTTYELADGQGVESLIGGVAHIEPPWPHDGATAYVKTDGETVVQVSEGFTKDPVVVAAALGWMLKNNGLEDTGPVIMEPAEASDFIERVQADWGTQLTTDAI